MLYERCEKCKGTRVGSMGGTCMACLGHGYHATGLTMAQVDRLVEAERRRLGDPPAVARAEAKASRPDDPPADRGY